MHPTARTLSLATLTKLCLAFLLIVPRSFGAEILTEPQQATFTNPVIANGADPWVIRWEEQYFLSQSRRGGIWVNRSKTLSGMGENHWMRVWAAPANTAYSRNIWAPELQRINGECFIYFAADDGRRAEAGPCADAVSMERRRPRRRLVPS